MVTLIVFSVIILLLGAYMGTFRHYSKLDTDFNNPIKDESWRINETIKGDYRMEIRIVLLAIILVISVICICFTVDKGASISSFMLISPMIYSLGYSITREILKSKRYFPGILSFSQHPLTFRAEYKGYTIIDFLAVIYLFMAVLGVWLYISWNL